MAPQRRFPMSLYALGLNHTTAPLDVREQVAFPPDALGHALRDLMRRAAVKEAAILSTCNRTELYVHGAEPAPVVAWLEDFHRVPKDSLAPYIYTLPRDQAVTHAFRVASGLDSMVLGEPQILGQMKQAVRHAESAGTLGLVLNRLFQRTFAVAKDVRTQTDIGSASISMAAAAVKLAERIFPSIAEQRVLLIGAGEMIELDRDAFRRAQAEVDHGRQPHAGARPRARRALRRRGDHAERDAGPAARNSTSSSPARRARCRSSARGCSSAWSRRAATRRCSSSISPCRATSSRRRRSWTTCSSTASTTSSEIVKDNLQIRREAVAQAEEMIATQAGSFLRWLEGRTVVPTITALHGHHDELRAAELERARRLLAGGARSGAGAGSARARPHQQVPARAAHRR